VIRTRSASEDEQLPVALLPPDPVVLLPPLPVLPPVALLPPLALVPVCCDEAHPNASRRRVEIPTADRVYRRALMGFTSGAITGDRR
jgi:hypothetical protein